MILKYLYDEFCMNWPSLVDKIISYKLVNGKDLEVKLTDGTAMMYDGLYHYTRTISKDEGEMTDHELTREFGHRLRSIMESKRMAQVELAEKTGIQRNAISQYVNGKTCPTYAKLVKLARALNCSLDDFRYL